MTPRITVGFLFLWRARYNKKNMEPFYDPEKSYEENYTEGPFSIFADGEILKREGEPAQELFGNPLYTPFGIPAGPLLNGNFVKGAFDKGFDIATYKTVRSNKYPCHPWPNVLAVKVQGDLTLERAGERLIADNTYNEPLSITNSFGVPSRDPDVWQQDMADAARSAGKGQVMIGSFQGTSKNNGDVGAYIEDFVTTAELVRETGAKILEANLSCPNEGTASLLCFDIERARTITDAIKNKIGDTSLILKMGYFKEMHALRDFVKEVGSMAQGLCAINTIPAEIVDTDGTQALPGEGRLRSGVCGHAVQWAGLDMVQRLKALRDELGLSYAIIGVGGVATPADYTKYREAGADVVQSATGAMWNGRLAQEIWENSHNEQSY